MDAAVASNLMLKINVWQLIITSKGFLNKSLFKFK